MKKLLVFILLCQSCFVFAQTETQVRSHYTDVNKRIAESIEHGFEGPLYNNEWVTNKNGRSWPAVGRYTETIDFWYDDPPDHISAAERNPKTVLLKVTISRIASHLSTKEEYLFKDGKLLFYYLKDDEEGNQWETRVYFNNKGLAFKSIVKANEKELTVKELGTEQYKDFKPNPAVIQSSAKKYQDLFVKSM